PVSLVFASPGSSMPWALGRMVLSSGALAAGSCALIYYLTQKAFSKASYYQLALEQLHSRPEALEALGAPLSVHHLHLTDRDNFVDITSARLKIPVSGSKSQGLLHVHSSRDGPFQRWRLQEVFLKLQDGQQIPVFKLSENTGHEVENE
uniref:Cytochrome c oxidase assembly factor 1 homolog n=2 Tax=Mustela putorius furo TaxID=9669 RepID=M3Z376_MUSPF